jgi:hypothetical protein
LDWTIEAHVEKKQLLWNVESECYMLKKAWEEGLTPHYKIAGAHLNFLYFLLHENSKLDFVK